MPGNLPEKSETPSQLAELLIKALKPGGVGVGGLSGLYLLLIQHKVAESIAAVLIGFSFSYLGYLLGPIHRGNKRRLGELGEALDNAIDGNIEQLFATLTRAEDAYLITQALDCRDYKSEGMGGKDRIFTPMLKEVFVPLKIDSGAIKPGLMTRLFRRSDPTQEQYIWNFLSHAQRTPAYRKVAIVAWGGYGKTTLLKHLAYIFGTKQNSQYNVPLLIPVLLPLRQYRQVLTKTDKPDLPELIMNHHIQKLNELNRHLKKKLPANWIQDKLKKGKVLVMMDGFDEIPEKERPIFCKWINTQMKRFDNSIFILTSRPTAYRDNYDEPPFTKLWVRPFKPEQQEKFVNQWYFSQEKLARGGRDTPEVQREATQNANNLLNQIRDDERPDLADLAKNPLLLNLLATFHRSEPGVELPRQRAQLYQDICTLQLRKRPDAREIKMSLLPDERQAILQILALRIMQDNLRLIPEEQLLQWIGEILAEQKHQVEAKLFLKQIIDVSELMVSQGNEGCEFSHLSFQEYLAAAQIKALHQESLLYPSLKDADLEGTDNSSWWRQTILLYAAQTNPTALIQEALRQGATNLAYACWEETRRTLDPKIEADLQTLKPTLQKFRYSKLEELLKTQQWREADAETYRLMITTVGKEEGQCLEPQDFQTFPCEDLKALDRLWVKYSNGKWGFSVQKQIWEECGSPQRYHKDWAKFCLRVGWKKRKMIKTEWKLYNEQNFDLKKSLPGEFPSSFRFIGQGVYTLQHTLENLFSRAETCRL